MFTTQELGKSQNLLPPFQRFSLVDAAYGDDESDEESVGENRGVVATRLLVEMSHEVRGDAVEDSSEDILRNKLGKNS